MTIALEDLDPEVREAARLQVVHELWRLGDLGHLWHETQERINEAIENAKGRQFFVCCSRRLGKSFYLLTKGFEQCLQHPGSRVLYLAPWAKDAAEIASDIVAKLLKECPDDLKPEYKGQTRELVFGNGSIMRFKGVNGETSQNLRGTEAHLIILDEAAIMDNLESIVKSVCLPMVLSTNGRIIFATTPAMTTGHDSFKIYSTAAARGNVAIFTLRDAPHYTPEVKAEFLIEAGEDPKDVPDILAGKSKPRTTTALREYWCEWVSDSESRVVPEWTSEAAAEIVQPVVYDGTADAYTVLDPGFKDGAGILYAYYDFLSGNIKVAGESLLYQANTSELAEELLDKEYQLFQGAKPYMRYIDADPRLRADFLSRHGILILPAQKQKSLEAINLVRTMVRNRELVIDPSCVNLIKQLEHGIWNKKGTDFERDEDGHLDLLACLKYLCRMVDRRKMPAGYVRSDRIHENRFHGNRVRQLREKNAPSIMPKTAWGKKMGKEAQRLWKKRH